MSPIRKLSLAYRSPTTASFASPAGSQPPLPTTPGSMQMESLPGDRKSPTTQTLPARPPLSPRRVEDSNTFETPKRKESLRDRRARHRTAQSQRSSYDALNGTQPGSPTANASLPIPPVTTIVPPPIDLAIPHLPNDNVPTIATSSTSDPASADTSTNPMVMSGRSMPTSMDARKLTRIAQAMGLVSTGPSSSMQDRRPRSKRISVGDHSLPRRRPSVNGTFPSPARSGFSAASSNRTGRAHGAGRAADLGGRGHLVQIVPPDHLFVPSGFSPTLNLEDIEQKPGSSSTLSSDEKELRRWRRGRLLPLRGTMDGMIKDVVKEWGLPSGIGMTLYLVNEEEKAVASSEEDESGQEYEGGMKCSPEAWKILWADLFNPINVRLPSSRFPSPRGQAMTVRNGSLSVLRADSREDLADDPNANPFRASANNRGLFEGFLTPASARSFQLFNSDTGNSPGKRSSLAPSASASQTNSPPRKVRKDSNWTDDQTSPTFEYAPRSLFQSSQRPSRIVGKIEFDFDRDRAKWYEVWRKRRQQAAEIPRKGGLRPLRLGVEDKELDSGEQEAAVGTRELEQHKSIELEQAEPKEKLREVKQDEPEDVKREESEEFNQEEPEQLQQHELTETKQIEQEKTEQDEVKELDPGEPDDLTQTASTLASVTAETSPETPEESASEYSVEQSPEGYAQLDDESLDGNGEEAASESSAGNLSPDVDEEEFAILRADRLTNEKTEFGFDDIGSNAILDDRIPDAKLAGDSEEHDTEPLSDVQEVAMLIAQRQQASVANTPLLNVPDEQGQGLASPINLPSPQTASTGPVVNTPTLSFTPAQDRKLSIEIPEATTPAMFGLGMGLDMAYDKRGSSLVMSDQLDLLERAMKDLSPREIRMSVFGPSSTNQPATKPAGQSRLVEDISPKTMDIATMEGETGLESIPAQTPGTSPAMPNGILTAKQQKYTPRSIPDGTAPVSISPETMARMEYEHVPKQPNLSAEGGWRPQRPARPPSPRLDQFAAPSPPVVLRDLSRQEQEFVMPPRTTEGMSPDLGDGRPRSNSGKGKSLFNNGPLNKLFQRKTSDRSDHDDVGLTVTHISGPIMIPDGNESMVRPVMPMFSPTPSQDEFGVLHNTNNGSAQTAQSTSGKSPKTPGFGRRLFKGPFGSHGRSVSSPKITPAIGNGQPSSAKPAQIPGSTGRSPSNPLPQRGRTSSAPTIESAEATSMRADATTPRSPSTSDTNNTTPISPGTTIKRKPVPRKEEDAFLPTSQSTMSLASVLMDDVPRNAKNRKASGHTMQDLTLVKSRIDPATIGAPTKPVIVEGQSKEASQFFS